MPTLTVEEMYRRAISLFDDVDLKDLLKSQIIKQMVPFKSNKNLALNNELSAFQELINVQFDDWLPDDILNKTDKITMGQSIEARVPFLDEEVIDASLRLPMHRKLNFNQTKLC